MLAQADRLFDQADAALADGDLATFQQRLNQARDKVAQANELLAGDERRRRLDDHDHLDNGARDVAGVARPGSAPADAGLAGRRVTDKVCLPNDAGWSSLVARRAHNPKVAGSNPAPATK